MLRRAHNDGAGVSATPPQLVLVVQEARKPRLATAADVRAALAQVLAANGKAEAK